MDCTRTILDILDRSEAQLMYNMSEMTAELEISVARTPGPETLPGDVFFVEDALTKVGHAMGRYMDPTPISHDLLDRESVASDEKIAEILSRVKDDSPKIDPGTEQGIAEATANMIGRAEAAIGQATDPVVKREIKKFEKKGARGVASFLAKPVNFGRRHFLKAVSAGALAAVLASCAPNVIGPVIIPDGGGGGTYPTTTEASPVMVPTETAKSTPTEVPTPTPEATPEVVFVPEGFAVTESGLLKNPETGKDALAFNPEADWEKVREGVIGGLWQANVDWYKLTGEGSDALNYSQEEFIKAALEGKVLRIGIPVRDNRLREEVVFGKSSLPIGIRFKAVDVKLDSIQVQLLDPNATRVDMGEKGWLAEDQEAFVLRFEDAASGNGSLLFEVNEQGQLVISVGSYYFGDMVTAGRQFEIGRFGSGLNEKYPSYFRSDGLGVDADKALSLYFAAMADWFNYIPDGKSYVLSRNSSGKLVTVSTLKTVDSAQVWNMDGWYLNPPVFKFVE